MKGGGREVPKIKPESWSVRECGPSKLIKKHEGEEISLHHHQGREGNAGSRGHQKRNLEHASANGLVQTDNIFFGVSREKAGGVCFLGFWWLGTFNVINKTHPLDLRGDKEKKWLRRISRRLSSHNDGTEEFIEHNTSGSWNLLEEGVHKAVAATPSQG